MEHSRYLPQVKDQYENLPYPLRDPEDEKKRLGITQLEGLDRMNYYCYSGKQGFSANFRALVAGGGTGDATVYLAEQLRDTGAEVVHLDLSQASIEVAKQRAAIRRLNNIRWIQGSLLDIPGLGIGQFDYINCSGVLHHLADPDEGLSVLSGALKADGAMGIMVYGQYGRMAVYQIQELMRLINRDESDTQVRINRCRSVLRSLPETHWARISDGHNNIWLSRILDNDNEIYDLFLHSQDRAYTIPQLYKFVEGAGLHIIQFFPTAEMQDLRLYDPGMYIKDSALLETVRRLDLPEQQAAAELMHGMISRHVFYAAKSVPHLPRIDNLDNIPFLNIVTSEQGYRWLHDGVRQSRDRVQLLNNRGQKLFEFRKTPHAEEIFRHLDGKKSIKEMLDAIMASTAAGQARPVPEQLLEEFREIFDALTNHGWLFLRAPATAAFKTVPEMQNRVARFYPS
jgi:2-polyprenyl-3-methyl-5-hydroxy-6-metoxy-1,4-benzoquinol methylase